MRMLSRRRAFGCLAAVLVIAAALTGCKKNETGQVTGQVQSGPAPLPMPSVQPTIQPTVQATPTAFVLGPLFDPSLDLRADPVDLPLELEIPSLDVTAPIAGVGLTSENVMDSPKGPIGGDIWHTAFWYRGGGIPGESGTATIAGHVNDPLGRPEIFANLEDLKAGDLIIIHVTTADVDIRFVVDQVKVHSVQESSDPVVLTQIYGAGPVNGTAPQPAPDGLSHLTLITCAGNIVNGEFDHHTVVYATRSK